MEDMLMQSSSSFPPSTVPNEPRRILENWEDDKIYTLQQWVTEQSWDAATFGPGNILFAYVEGLIYCQLAKAPKGVPLATKWYGPFRPKYDRFWLGDVYPDADSMELWNTLREELVELRQTLVQIRRYVEIDFNFEKMLRQRLDSVMRDVHAHMWRLEVVEARLREDIGMMESRKRTEMGKTSLRNSDRQTMLRKCPEFFESLFGLANSL